MRSASEPAVVPAARTGNLTDCVVDTAREVPEHVSVSRRTAAGDWQDLTARQFLDDVRALAKGLVAYDAEDALKIVGLRSHDIEQTLGYRGRDELIHRDDLVLL